MSATVSFPSVLITGAGGFIGSHLATFFVSQGSQVVGVDNFITGNRANLDALLSNETETGSFTLIKANASESPENYMVKGFVPDLVLHFASPASPPLYQKYPVDTYLVNSMGTHQLLSWLKKVNPKAQFSFASTSEIYGDPLVHPQTESYWGNVNPNGIRSCYDEAKRFGETICGVHYRDFGMDVRIVRIFNTYGPRMDINDGRVIPDFAKQILQNKPVQVFGDGQQTRSYCYIDDLVKAITTFAMTPGAAGKTINIGNPDEYTVLQTAERIFEVAKKLELTTWPRLERDWQPLPTDDPTKRRPDISQAQKLLTWQPMISFEAGLESTLNYFTSVINR